MLNPQKPIPEPLFKNVELVSGSGHFYKVRTRANDNFAAVYWSKVVANIKKQILGKIKESEPEEQFLVGADPDGISLESVDLWMKTRPMTEPVYKVSFYEVICEPIDGAPPVEDIFLDIDPDYCKELDDFFARAGLAGNVSGQEEMKSTPSSKKPGKTAKKNSPKHTQRATSRRSSSVGS